MGEVFTTPSIIPEDKELFIPAKDTRLAISDKELNTAKKSLRKLSIPDSIFKMKTASYSTLPTELFEPAKPNTFNEATNVCLSINENSVEVEPLPEVSVLKVASIMKLPSPPGDDSAEVSSVLNETDILSLPAPPPRPLTPLPTILLDAPFHPQLELTPMPRSDLQDHESSSQSKSSDFDRNANENMEGNTNFL